jgi:predicted ester cyclase
MPLSPAEMDRKLDAHFAYEAADDVEGVLHTLAPDVEHDIVGVRSQRRLYGDNFMVDDSVWTGTAPGAPFGIAGGGRPLEFRLLHVIEFAESGQIQRENVWVDLGAIQRQLAA